MKKTLIIMNLWSSNSLGEWLILVEETLDPIWVDLFRECLFWGIGTWLVLLDAASWNMFLFCEEQEVASLELLLNY